MALSKIVTMRCTITLKVKIETELVLSIAEAEDGSKRTEERTLGLSEPLAEAG